ncbi:MAG: hypothetical protein K9G48_15345 [Reyranella sp.]|nr:hypothetical protein [Reyranella sp.]
MNEWLFLVLIVLAIVVALLGYALPRTPKPWNWVIAVVFVILLSTLILGGFVFILLSVESAAAATRLQALV